MSFCRLTVWTKSSVSYDLDTFRMYCMAQFKHIQHFKVPVPKPFLNVTKHCGFDQQVAPDHSELTMRLVLFQHVYLFNTKVTKA